MRALRPTWRNLDDFVPGVRVKPEALRTWWHHTYVEPKPQREACRLAGLSRMTARALLAEAACGPNCQCALCRTARPWNAAARAVRAGDPYVVPRTEVYAWPKVDR